jgi:hypothetical protein
MAKYGQAAQKRVESAMHRRKKGTLKSGSGATVKSREQAIAIGLSEAREKGGKVPRARKTAGKSAAKKGAAKKGAARKSGAKKGAAKKGAAKKRSAKKR